jgi:hypothetical protein
MNPSEIEAYFVKLASYNQQQNERMEQAIQHMNAIGARLDESAGQLNAGGERFAEKALGIIAAEAQQVITDNVGQASKQLSSHLTDSARTAQQAAQGLQTQRTLLSRAQTALVWKGLGALIIGSVLAVGGSGYFVWKSMRQIEQANFGQDILQATQSGALNRCGGMLCARVGKRPQRYGDGGDYVLLQP